MDQITVKRERDSLWCQTHSDTSLTADTFSLSISPLQLFGLVSQYAMFKFSLITNISMRKFYKLPARHFAYLATS